MNAVNRFAVSIALLVTLTLPVCAGEMSNPPCPPPVPGEMSAPLFGYSTDPRRPDTGANANHYDHNWGHGNYHYGYNRPGNRKHFVAVLDNRLSF